MKTTKALTNKKVVAFDFVLEELYSIEPTVKAMFGCHAIYVRGKIVLMLRRKETYQYDNGVWIATTRDHHMSLRKDFPAMRTIRLFGGPESEWQNLPADSDDFEADVIKVCKLILKGDLRIGKIPKPRRAKNRAIGPR
jgi:hypothetical protein